MPELDTTALYNCFIDEKNWDIRQTARELIILESSIALELSPELPQKLDELKSQDIGLDLLPDFAKRFLEVCLEEEDRSLHPDDLPLLHILEYVDRIGCFAPDTDKKRIKSLKEYDRETVTAFCKSLAYRGLANWSDRCQAITKEAIAPEPDDYDYHWHSL